MEISLKSYIFYYVDGRGLFLYRNRNQTKPNQTKPNKMSKIEDENFQLVITNQTLNTSSTKASQKVIKCYFKDYFRTSLKKVIFCQPI